MSTYHAFCVKLLRRNIHLLDEGYTQSLSVIDRKESRAAMVAVVERLRLVPLLPPLTEEQQQDPTAVSKRREEVKEREKQGTPWLAGLECRMDVDRLNSMARYGTQD